MNPLNESEMLEIIGDSLVITVDNHNVMGGDWLTYGRICRK